METKVNLSIEEIKENLTYEEVKKENYDNIIWSDGYIDNRLYSVFKTLPLKSLGLYKDGKNGEILKIKDIRFLKDENGDIFLGFSFPKIKYILYSYVSPFSIYLPITLLNTSLSDKKEFLHEYSQKDLFFFTIDSFYSIIGGVGVDLGKLTKRNQDKVLQCIEKINKEDEEILNGGMEKC